MAERTRELPPIGTPERAARDLLDTGCLGCPTCRVRGKRVARALLDQYAQSARKSEDALCEVCGAHPAVLEARWLNRGTTMRYCAADACRADVDLTMRTYATPCATCGGPCRTPYCTSCGDEHAPGDCATTSRERPTEVPSATQGNADLPSMEDVFSDPALLNARVRFWCCPDHVGAPHRVEWEGDVARCLTCGRTSATPQSADQQMCPRCEQPVANRGQHLALDDCWEWSCAPKNAEPIEGNDHA